MAMARSQGTFLMLLSPVYQLLPVASEINKKDSSSQRCDQPCNCEQGIHKLLWEPALLFTLLVVGATYYKFYKKTEKKQAIRSVDASTGEDMCAFKQEKSEEEENNVDSLKEIDNQQVPDVEIHEGVEDTPQQAAENVGESRLKDPLKTIEVGKVRTILKEYSISNMDKKQKITELESSIQMLEEELQETRTRLEKETQNNIRLEEKENQLNYLKLQISKHKELLHENHIDLDDLELTDETAIQNRVLKRVLQDIFRFQ